MRNVPSSDDNYGYFRQVKAHLSLSTRWFAALYKGDTRTRTIDVYVDDAKITTWTSSGTNAGFESFGLDTQGQVIELRATDSEWLSILEVRSFRRV